MGFGKYVWNYRDQHKHNKNKKFWYCSFHTIEDRRQENLVVQYFHILIFSIERATYGVYLWARTILLNTIYSFLVIWSEVTHMVIFDGSVHVACGFGPVSLCHFIFPFKPLNISPPLWFQGGRGFFIPTAHSGHFRRQWSWFGLEREATHASG